MRPPPVRIGLAQAREQNSVRTLDADLVAEGATAFGMRRGVYASVGPRLRIDKRAGVNREAATSTAIPLGRLRRKRGYPPITGE